MRKRLLACLPLLISSLAVAQANPEYSLDKGIHTIGAGFGLGTLNGDIPVGSENDHGVWNIYYNYAFDRTYSLEASFMSGDTDDSLCILCGVFADDDLLNNQKFRALTLSGKGAVPISQRWSLYSKLGLNTYRTTPYNKFRGNKSDAETSTGVGLFAGAGIEFRAFNGVGVNFEYHYLDMGGIDASAGQINLSYRF